MYDNKEIIITKHALQEFKNDYPRMRKEMLPRVLKNKFKHFKFLSKTGKAKYSYNKLKEASIIKYQDECIVYSDNIIITYYRTLNYKGREVKYSVKSNINQILNGDRKVKQQVYVEEEKITKTYKPFKNLFNY